MWSAEVGENLGETELAGQSVAYPIEQYELDLVARALLVQPHRAHENLAVPSGRHRGRQSRPAALSPAKACESLPAATIPIATASPWRKLP